jgi:hypothetical protein
LNERALNSETSSLLIVIAIIAAAIIVPLLLIGGVVLIFLPVVRRRRKTWQAAARTLGLECDTTSMWGVRELPVRIFWQVEGQSVGQLDVGGAVLAGRHDMRGGRAGLRYVYCRALLEPPLNLGLTVMRRLDGAPTIRTDHAAFDNQFSLSARDATRAHALFKTPVAEMFAQIAHCGWQVAATDEYIQIRLGGDYFSQFPEQQPELLSSALETAVMCGRHLLEARQRV